MKKLLLALLVLLGLQTQAQISPCDSISYTATSTINYPFIVAGVANIPGTISWSWQVCNSSLCYSGTGANANFGQVSLTDTLKVCYSVLIDINGVTYTCARCDTLVYNPNSYQWESKVSNPILTSITDLQPNATRDSKIYDLLGRELTSIPIGKLYIRGRRLCICK